MRALLVEDDEMIGRSLRQGLEGAGWSVDWVRDGSLAQSALADGGYTCVLLDLGLPRQDGTEVLRRARSHGDATPVLVLTARDGLEDRIHVLDLGADDYLLKPFALRELLARMRAVVRRRDGAAHSVIGTEALRLDLTTREVQVRGARETLTAREFALLHALLERPGAILSREQLENRIYGWGEEVTSNAVDVLIHGMRRKLGAEAIRNVRGLGVARRMSALADAKPRSLRNRLLAGLAVLHLVAMVATAWFSYGAYGRLVNLFMDDQMRLVAQAHAVHHRAPALPPVGPEDVHARGAFVVQVWDADGGTLLASSWPELGVPLQPAAGFADVRAGAAGDVRWRVFTGPATAGAPRVQVLQDEQFRQARIVRRALLEGLPILVLLPIALAILWGIVWSASRSLRTVAHEVAAQDEASAAEVAVARVPEEIAPLVAAFNSLLARLRDAVSAQRRFLQDAAHELRTPMAAIGLQLDNLRAHVPPGDAAERFGQLEAGVARAQHLIEQLLRLSRQGAPGAGTGASAEVDVAALLRDSVGELMVLADRRRIDIGFEGSAAPLTVAAPAADLRSVFDNLIDNAVRYAPEGGVVDVRLHLQGGQAVVDVLDNGPGIPAALQERVFDRFFRVAGSPAGGSGLGLAIARAAAARHGLRIALANRSDGPGLCARVHLPLSC